MAIAPHNIKLSQEAVNGEYNYEKKRTYNNDM